MAAKATELKFAGGKKNHGEFKIDKFNIFEPEEMMEYASLRTKANDASKGIMIENIREYSRKVVTSEGDGADRTMISTEDVYLLVQYWEKVPKKESGDSENEKQEAKKDWSIERTAR
jgi:hypothetical protein